MPNPSRATPRRPLFLSNDKAHGRREQRHVRLMEITPQATGYPGARTLVVVERQRQPTRATPPAQETSYYLSSHAPDEITPERMGQLIRGHWSAVENNTHWRRDHLMGEDGTRSRRPVLLVNLALMRNALLALMADELRGQNQEAFKESVQRRPALALRLLRSR